MIVSLLVEFHLESLILSDVFLPVVAPHRWLGVTDRPHKKQIRLLYVLELSLSLEVVQSARKSMELRGSLKMDRLGLLLGRWRLVA